MSCTGTVTPNNFLPTFPQPKWNSSTQYLHVLTSLPTCIRLHLLHHYILDNNWFFFRFARSNSIFLGLWFGYKKPDFLTFLQPLSKEFQDIYSQGIFKLYLRLAIYKLDIHVLCVIILKIFVHDIELSLLYMQLHNLLLQVWKLPTVKEKTSH